MFSSATIFGLSSIHFIAIGIVLTILGMRSISGFIWILWTICILFSVKNFDKWPLAIPYAMCAYISIILQIFTIKIFRFDIEELKRDFLGGKQVVQDVVIKDMKKSIEITKNVAGQIIKNTGNINTLKIEEEK